MRPQCLNVGTSASILGRDRGTLDCLLYPLLTSSQFLKEAAASNRLTQKLIYTRCPSGYENLPRKPVDFVL